jgi:hypothetical protein
MKKLSYIITGLTLTAFMAWSFLAGWSAHIHNHAAMLADIGAAIGCAGIIMNQGTIRNLLRTIDRLTP